MRKQKPCTILILCRPPSPLSSQTDFFRVPHSFSTVESTEIVLPMASQVVTPPVQYCNSPLRIAYGHSLLSLAIASTVCSTLCCTLPLLLRSIRCHLSHGSRVINSQSQYFNAMVWPSISCLVILGLSTRHAYVTLFSSLLISMSINMLFFLIITDLLQVLEV